MRMPKKITEGGINWKGEIKEAFLREFVSLKPEAGEEEEEEEE